MDDTLIVPKEDVTIKNHLDTGIVLEDDDGITKVIENEEQEVIALENGKSDQKELGNSSELNDKSVITTLTTACVEYSFGTFFNWFMPSCMDVWTSDDTLSSSADSTCSTQPSAIIAYGARSFLFLLNVSRKVVEGKGRLLISEDVAYSINYRDLVNVFNHTINKKFVDVFRANNTYITTVVFEKPREFWGKHHKSNSTFISEEGPRVFVGNSDGSVALYNVIQRESVFQDVPFNSYKLPCCRKVTQSKILSASWLHFRSIGSVVFYSLDTHLIKWETKENVLSVQHDNNQECGVIGKLIGQVQISCLASMSSECTSDKLEHKLAVGYMGGKVIIFGFDPMSGIQKSITFLTDNSHNDDICSLSFSSYSVGSIPSYRSGLLCSVSRDSVLKVWSCANQSELAEFRINGQFIRNHSESDHHLVSSNFSKVTQHQMENQNKCNWFCAMFLPRNNVVSPASGTSNSSTSGKGASYELLITAPSGELITITIPDKELNSKLRIAKATKFTTRGGLRTCPGISQADYSHQSVVFSIMISAKLGFAITYSLDYKMLLWDLTGRHTRAVFHLFSNGALSIDSCLRDKRISVAFGNSVYTLDFGNIESNHVSTNRCATAPKNWKFYQVSWNNLSDSERLGALVFGNSQGEVLYFDLNERTYVVKPSNRSHNKNGDSSKIYKFVWPVKFPVGPNSSNLRTVVLSLHASGTILVNYLPSRNCPFKQPENFMTSKFVCSLPPESQLRKHTAVDSLDRGRILVIGNDDGTVDILTSLDDICFGQLYRHLFRFRAFTRPILSVEVSGEKDLWLSVTAMQDNFVNCYKVEQHLLIESENVEANSNGDFNVRQLPNRYKLVGHQDRIAASCWSPFVEELKSTNETSLSAPLLVTASYDTTCIVWNVVKQLPLKRFYGHRSLIYTIVWSHFNPELIFTGGEDCFHCWNWTKQPDYCADSAFTLLGKSMIKIISLKKIKNELLKEVTPESTDQIGTTSLAPVHTKETKPFTKSSSSTTAPTSIPTGPVKALFSLSNQIENNSSKYEMLDDIKWIFKLRQFYLEHASDQVLVESVIPETKLSRVALYGNRAEVLKFLQLEEDNHRKNGQLDSADLVSWFGDLLGAIRKSIDQGEADLEMASLVVNYSREMYRECVSSYWETVPNTQPKNASQRYQLSKSQRLLSVYGKEMRALSQLYSLMDFDAAINGLLEHSLFREAIVLAQVIQCSETFIELLWHRWQLARIANGSPEGAVKCLVAAGKLTEAVQLLEQRRLLCADNSASTVVKQYDEVIRLLKDEEEVEEDTTEQSCS